MKHSKLTPKMLAIGAEILEWSNTYLAQENENIKRPKGSQVVCPFVKPSINNNTYFLTFHPEIKDNNKEAIVELMLDYINEFKTTSPLGPGSVYKKAFVVVLNNLSKEDAEVLDVVHSIIKDTYVTNGLMIGQFHPNCQDKGAFNSEFNVSVSPYPLFAIRNIAMHDILFLGEKEAWFRAYDKHYGSKFKRGELDEHTNHLERFYWETKAKYEVAAISAQ